MLCLAELRQSLRLSRISFVFIELVVIHNLLKMSLVPHIFGELLQLGLHYGSESFAVSTLSFRVPKEVVSVDTIDCGLDELAK